MFHLFGHSETTAVNMNTLRTMRRLIYFKNYFPPQFVRGILGHVPSPHDVLLVGAFR